MGFRSFIFPLAVSLFCSLLVFFLFRIFPPSIEAPGPHPVGDAWALITLPMEEDETLVLGRLEGAGLEALSLSSQTILLDDYGTLVELPLDLYLGRLNAGDPRDTGYAQRLESFFQNDEGRSLYVPLEDPSQRGLLDFQRRVEHLLEGIPYGLNFLSLVLAHPLDPAWEPFLFPLLLALSLGAGLCISRSRGSSVFSLPLLFSFYPLGLGALVLGALCSCILELLRLPAEELIQENRFMSLAERLRPFRLNALLALLIFLVCLVYPIIFQLPLVPVWGGLFFFLLVQAAVFLHQTQRLSSLSRRPFVPVIMVPQEERTFFLFPQVIPFMGAALVVLALPLFSRDLIPGPGTPVLDSSTIIGEAEYRAHGEHQISFSYRPLGNGDSSEYRTYFLGEDGLIAGSHPSSPRSDLPPFPLETLMAFLLEYKEQSIGEEPFQGGPFFDPVPWMGFLIILGTGIFDLLRPVLGGPGKGILHIKGIPW